MYQYICIAYVVVCYVVSCSGLRQRTIIHAPWLAQTLLVNCHKKHTPWVAVSHLLTPLVKSWLTKVTRLH